MRNGMRAYVSDNSRKRNGSEVAQPLVIRVGPLHTSGSLYSMLSPVQDGKYKLCTPDGKPVHQVYQDDDGNTFESKDELERAKVVDGEYELVNKELLEDARVSPMDKNLVVCSIHKLEDVEDISWPTKKSSYVFYPTESNVVNVKTAKLIVPIVKNYAVMTQANINGHEGLYRLDTYKNRLVLVPQVYSDHFNPHEEDPEVLEPETIQGALELAEKLVEPPDAEEYRDQHLNRLRLAEAAALGHEDIEVLLAQRRKVIDFDSILASALSAVQ